MFEGWRAATCMPDSCFCEAIRDGLLKQPVNALSSLAFVVVALLVLRSSKNMNVFAFAMAVIGLGSAFYHASLSFIGQFVDVMGMYLIATYVIVFAIGRLRTLTRAQFVSIYLAMNAMLAWGLWHVPEARRYAFAAVLLAGLATESFARAKSAPKPDGRKLVAAVGLLTAGFILWILDITHIVCSPESVFQGHAVWHILGAASSWQLFRYYQSLLHTDNSQTRI
jgi:hypothetical protein